MRPLGVLYTLLHLWPTLGHDNKDPVRPEENWSKEMLTRIFNKFEWSNKKVKELKNYFSNLSKMGTSHSVYIKQL